VYLSILAVSSQNKGLHATCKLMCHRSERTSFMRQKYTISSYSMKASLVSSLQMSSCWARARQDCVVLGMLLDNFVFSWLSNAWKDDDRVASHINPS
jgi:hypothetical protein